MSAPIKTKNRNGPVEMSSKIPVNIFRKVIEPEKPKFSDPRFDSACGKFNKDLFEKSFSFIGEMQKEEFVNLKESSKKSLKDKKKFDQFVSLQNLKNKKNRLNSILKERRKVEKELVSQGKKPFFLKKSEFKKIEIVDKYKRMQDDKNSPSINKTMGKKKRH